MHLQWMRFRASLMAVAALSLLSLGMNLQADDTVKPVKKRVPLQIPAAAPKARVQPKLVSPRAVTSTTISEVVAQDVTIPAGGSQQFYAQSDFSGAEVASLGFYATTDQDLSKTTYLVWWAPAGAPNYVVADYLQGGNFAFLNSGGSQVAIYGNQLMIEMRNTGNQPVTITQITAYAVAH